MPRSATVSSVLFVEEISGASLEPDVRSSVCFSLPSPPEKCGTNVPVATPFSVALITFHS